MSGLAERTIATEAALSVERSVLAAKKEKSREALQDLQIARTITVDKEEELELAIWTKLAAQENAARVQAELETTPVDLADAVITRAKDGKTVEVEFEEGFF